MVKRVTGIRVVYRQTALPVAWVGSTVCVTNPQSCPPGASCPSGISGASGPSGPGLPAGPGVSQTCCQGKTIESNIYLTLSGGSFGCECANGQTIPLVYNSGLSRWVADAIVCGKSAHFEFFCYDGQQYGLLLRIPSGAETFVYNVPLNCDDFAWHGDPLSLGIENYLCSIGGNCNADVTN